MTEYTLDNPVFRVYVLAAGLAILKTIWHAFLTVHRMMKVRRGFASPEDLRRTRFNPEPNAGQLAPDDYVERTRRMHRNELENTPVFLVAGLLFVAAAPPVGLAAAALFGYVAARIAHAWAYLTERDHEVRATFFTIGAALTVAMSMYAMGAAVWR